MRASVVMTESCGKDMEEQTHVDFFIELCVELNTNLHSTAYSHAHEAAIFEDPKRYELTSVETPPHSARTQCIQRATRYYSHCCREFRQ